MLSFFFFLAKGSFSQANLELIEAELESSIKNVLENLEIQNQLTWSKTILETRARRLEEESNLNDELLRSLQKKADRMYSSLYQCPKIRLRQFQPLDLNTNLPYSFPEVTVSFNLCNIFLTNRNNCSYFLALSASRGNISATYRN